ncbi:phosphoinositide 3-kinase regulatory subunit 5-like [Corythoichthys intestinalis]|uniref:phosphoinositide 3-kinase regulatory subunit 5-like n=1 Tax=Corythoichthys intestinalis TaxID=161448 RepID=UPI0025A5676F|nr:phosphoinositide 3-kinase regulatory subunit 5-like [Corythoichthys intestinalis]XP_061805448.1 phosphoinositide 3-kinase regulatory subunit 5-like [Nerophis lumbriciformis]
MEQNSCTEDRIQHVLERCLCDLEFNTPDKQLWNAGLCMNRWCLEELVMRDPNNFPFLLQTILKKTKEALVQCHYQLVVPLTLLFSSTLLKTPYLQPNCDVLLEAYLLFHRFLSWPDPYCTACQHLLNVIYNELRAPGISFQRLVKSEHGISAANQQSKTMMVLLVSPDEDIPPEIQSVTKQLSTSHQSRRDIIITLILHSFQAALGTKIHLQRLRDALQTKQPFELEQLLERVTCCMETAASTADLKSARQSLQQTMERLTLNLIPITGENYSDTGLAETFALPFPKCHTSYWENDNFDFLTNIVMSDCYLDLPPACLTRDEDDSNDINVEEVMENHSLSMSSCLSSSFNFPTSATYSSSGVERDFSEFCDDAAKGEKGQSKSRKKPKKKSKSLLGLENLSLFFKSPRSLGTEFKKSHSSQDQIRTVPSPLTNKDPPSPQKHLCIRRRPILSINESDAALEETLVRVLVFGRDREAGRLARAYSDLQQKEAKCPRLTKMCKLQFYFVPTKRTFTGKPSERHSSTDTGYSTKAASVPYSLSQEDSSTDLAQMLGVMDPWYDRSVHSLLSLSSDVLCQPACNEDSISENNRLVEHLPLMADLVLYYCRHAAQPVLVQLYRAELSLAGGGKRSEVFIHSVELGHKAATRAVKAMGAASKRFGIDEESTAAPLTLSVAYNKVACSGRSQWTQAEMLCTSINIHKACTKAGHLESRPENLWLSVTEITRKSSKRSNTQNFPISEVNVNRVEVSSSKAGTTFAVCLDQDERKFLQGVTRVEVSLCSKPGGSSDWKSYKPSPGQVQPLHASYCSMLCLPFISFSTSHA